MPGDSLGWMLLAGGHWLGGFREAASCARKGRESGGFGEVELMSIVVSICWSYVLCVAQ